MLSFTAVVIFYIWVRFSWFFNASQRAFSDTADWLAIANQSYASLGFWAGAKPPSTPLFWSLFLNNFDLIMFGQLLISIVAWTVLAGTIAWVVESRPIKLFGFALFLFASLSLNIMIWDRLLMSESIAISLTVLVVAAALFMSKIRTATSVIYFISVLTLWGFARDSHLLLLPIFVVFVLAVFWYSKKWHFALVGAAMIALFVAGAASISVGGRWVVPFYNLIVHRVVPDESKLEDMEALGLPVNDALIQRSNGITTKGVAFEEDPELSKLHEWVNAGGRFKYIGYLATHPIQTLTEPFGDIDNIIKQDVLSTFAPPGPTTVIGSKSGYFYNLPFGIPSAVILTMLAALITFVGLRWFGRIALWVSFVLLISVIPHGLIVWHADTAVIGRHAMPVAVHFRLAIYLSITIGLDLIWLNRDGLATVLRRQQSSA